MQNGFEFQPYDNKKDNKGILFHIHTVFILFTTAKFYGFLLKRCHLHAAVFGTIAEKVAMILDIIMQIN